MKKTILVVAMLLAAGNLHAFPPTNTIVACAFAVREPSTNTLQWMKVDLEQGRRFIGSMPYFGNLKDWNPWRDENLPRSTRVSPVPPNHFYFRMTTASGKTNTASFSWNAATVDYRGLGLRLVPDALKDSVLKQLELWKKQWETAPKDSLKTETE